MLAGFGRLRYAAAMRKGLITLICIAALAGLSACSKCDDFWGPKACRQDVPQR
jgi:hypothetical protein